MDRNKRNLEYEDKFKAYLYRGNYERFIAIAKKLNLKPVKGEW